MDDEPYRIDIETKILLMIERYTKRMEEAAEEKNEAQTMFWAGAVMGLKGLLLEIEQARKEEE